MKLLGMAIWTLGSIAVLSPCSRAQLSNRTSTKLDIRRAGALELHSVKADPVTYRGRSAMRLTEIGVGGDEVNSIAIVKGTSLKNGSVEVSLSGDTAPDAPPNLRGFVGVAFRVSTGGSRYECFYLRPKNGRSEDQLQRNHSVQYISVPDSPWDKLRANSPGKYESYVDLVPGAWTKMKIQFAGTNARLYVNGSEQPVLVVHDLAQPAEAGAVALWIGPGTIAHFSDISVSH